MAGETKMSSQNGRKRFPPQSVVQDVGEFAHDVVTLAELQVELLKADLQDFLKRMLIPVCLIASSAMIVLGSIPIALAALALGLVAAGLSYGLAFLLTTLIGFGIAACLGIAAWKTSSKMTTLFDRSRGELSRNIKWVKRVLTSKRRDRSTSLAK